MTTGLPEWQLRSVSYVTRILQRNSRNARPRVGNRHQ